MDIHIDIGNLLTILLALVPVGLWIAWWLWAVNWQRMGPALREGAWAPVLLLLVVSALAWSRTAPSDCNCLEAITIPNFWWQLGAVIGLALVALFCGWLQDVYGFAPPEVPIGPPVHALDHHHDDGRHQDHNGHDG